MTANVDDVHAYDSLFIKAMQRLEEADFSDYNKQLLEKFNTQLQRDHLEKSTRTNYLNQLTKMIKNLQKIEFTNLRFRVLMLLSPENDNKYLKSKVRMADNTNIYS